MSLKLSCRNSQATQGAPIKQSVGPKPSLGTCWNQQREALRSGQSNSLRRMAGLLTSKGLRAQYQAAGDNSLLSQTALSCLLGQPPTGMAPGLRKTKQAASFLPPTTFQAPRPPSHRYSTPNGKDKGKDWLSELLERQGGSKCNGIMESQNRPSCEGPTRNMVSN